jgi:hypothetical protein
MATSFTRTRASVRRRQNSEPVLACELPGPSETAATTRAEATALIARIDELIARLC